MSHTFVRCGTLFTATSAFPEKDQTLVFAGAKLIYVGPTAKAPPPQAGDAVIDHGSRFVMPGLIDGHVHISYGRALGEEDLDLYATMEFRAIRALHAAQSMLRWGFTSIIDPACSGLVSPSVRDAIDCGLYKGPRITAAGRALTTHQGLYDYYPSWIGAPDVSTGILVKSREETIQEIRRQAKDGVDMIKFALDGIMGDRKHGLYAAFDEDETKAMIREAKRLGRRVGVHARGREAAYYAAKHGADIIYHASRIDGETIRACLDTGCAISPSLLMLVNNIEFAQPQDPSYSWWPNIQRKELASARICIAEAFQAGVRLINGSESGFAVTLYGDWAARELEISRDLLGLTPGEALLTATANPAPYLRGAPVGTLKEGHMADFLVLDASPIENLSILQDPSHFVELRLGGELVDTTPQPQPGRHPSELAQGMWNRLYTRDYAAGLARQPLELQTAAE